MLVGGVVYFKNKSSFKNCPFCNALTPLAIRVERISKTQYVKDITCTRCKKTILVKTISHKEYNLMKRNNLK